MKRFLAVIFTLSALCALLWGCKGEGDITQPDTVTSSSASVSTEPTETEAQTEPTPTETIYAYEAKYTRLSEEALTELRPDENYGFILPYCAGLEHNDFCGEPYGHYGFMDASGKILVDPVYQYIKALTMEDGYEFAPCVWLMAQGEIVASDISGFHYHLNDQKCGLAAADGSVVIDLVYDDIEVLGNTIFAKKYLDESFETYDVDIYNFNCELIGSLTNLDVRILGFREDILRVEKDFGTYYMDLSGKLIAGPFYSAEDFSCGYGLVELDSPLGLRYTYVDKEGQLLSEEGWTFVAEDGTTYQITDFAEAQSFVGGVACVRVDHMWEQYSVLTTDNEFLFDFRIFNRFICEEDYILNNSLGSTEVYNHEGELLWSHPELELLPVSGDGAYLYDPFENKIYNWKTGEVTEGFEGVSDTELPSPYYEDFPYPLFLDAQKEEQIVTDQALNLIARMDQYAPIRRNALTGDYYFIDEEDGKCTLILPQLPQAELDIAEIAEGKDVQMYGDLIQCTDGGACCYYTCDMELVFCYPFSDYVPAAE